MVIQKKSLNTNTLSPNYKELVNTQVRKKYFYFLLGITILVVAYFILKSFFPKNVPKFTIKKQPVTETAAESKGKTYLTKNGDYLWKIAEENYGSGYNAFDIAKANKISDPNLILPGKKLILPEVTPKTPTKGEIAQEMTAKVTLTAAKYKVQPGDYLWKIALDAYGDGYAWVRIAKANNLANPDLIHSGNILNIPR